MTRVDLRLGYRCQNRCRFCPQGDWRERWPLLDEAELDARLRAARARGDVLVLSGGEPTLHPALGSLVALAKQLGFREIEVQTNGRALALPGAAEKLASAGATRVSPALHGDSPELHDALTREPGSFDETARAIRALSRAGLAVIVHTLILRPNLGRLARIARLAEKLGASASHYGLVNPVGDVEHAFDELVPKLAELPSALAPLSKVSLPLTLDGVPPCVAGEAARLLADAEPDTSVQDAPDRTPLPLASSPRRVFGPDCERCAAKSHCPGVFRLYATRRGFDELAPLTSFSTVAPPRSGSPRADRPIGAVLHRQLGVVNTIGIDHDAHERRVSVVLRTECNNRCDFCTTRIMFEEAGAPWTGENDVPGVLTALARYRQAGAERATFVAMEPLEHSGILQIVHGARELGFHEVDLWTNARRARDPAFARELVAAGLTHVRVPFFGATAEVHDAVTTRPGSFAEAWRGLESLRGAGLPREHVRFAYVVVRKNHHQLVDFIELTKASDLGVFVDYDIAAPSSHDLRFYEPIATRFDELARGLAERLPHASRSARACVEERFRRWLPPCVALRTFGDSILPAYATSSPSGGLSVRLEGALDGADAGEGKGREKKLRVACEKRESCAAATSCPGYFSEYTLLFGTSELEPISRLDGSRLPGRR